MNITRILQTLNNIMNAREDAKFVSLKVGDLIVLAARRRKMSF